MGSYSVLGGGVEVSSMSPVFSTGMQLQKPMYIMQEVHKPAQQQVWCAVPACNSQALRPAANTAMLQAAQPQSVPTVYSAAPRPLVAAQSQTLPMTFMTQAPGAMRLMQMPGGVVQLQQTQAQQRVVLAPQQQPQQLQPRQPGSEVVYVNVNGVLQQGVVQNGSVYLLNDSASAPAGSTMMQVQAAPGQQAPMTVTVAARQPGMAVAPVSIANGTQVIQLPNGQYQQQQVPVAGQQPVMMQQVLPAGGHLVPMSQPAIRPAQLPQQQMQMQQQQAQRPMMMVMQPNGGQQSSAPMGVVMVTGPQPAGMQQTAGARPQQMQMQAPMPTQKLMARSPAAPAAAAPRPAGVQLQQTVQPMQFTNGAGMQQQMRPAAAAPNGMSMAGAAAAPNSQQAGAQAFRPALAAGAKILVPSTSVSASTASLGKAPAAPTAAAPQQRQLAGPLSNSNGSGVPALQPVMVPGSGMQPQQLLPGGNGEMSSPHVPPITPGVVMGAPAAGAPGDANGSVYTTAGSSLLAQLNGSNSGSPNIIIAGSSGDNAVVRMGFGSQSPSHGAIGSQRSSKDGMGASRSGTPAPAGSSPPRSQPGTPARSNSGGGLAAAATGSAHSNNDKGAVMRLVARSFIETDIALEQALTMIQPADKELLAAAFAAEAAGAPLPSSKPAAAAASDALVAASVMNGVGSMLSGLGLGFGGGVQSNSSTTAAAGSDNGGKGLFGGEGLSQLSSLSFVDDVSYANDNNSINMGTWGFSLFTGSGISDLNGSAAGLSSLGPADPLLADVAAAPAAAQQPAGAAGKDSASAGMLASLNL